MSRATKEVLNQLKGKSRKTSDVIQIKNQTATSADLYFYGDIVADEWDKWVNTDTAPEDVRKALDSLQGTESLNLYINSGGGSVFAGLAIYNMLKRHSAHKTVHIDGLAGSIASVIALAGDKVVMPSNAFMMIHKPMLGVFGNANDLKKAINDLDAIETGIMNVYAENLKEGADIKKVKKLVDAETWLNGTEAAQYFNIEVAEANEAVACASDYFKQYKSIPDEVKAHTGENEQPEGDASKDELKSIFEELWNERMQEQPEPEAQPEQQPVQNWDRQKYQNKLKLMAMSLEN